MSRLYVAGIGAGAYEDLTLAAAKRLAGSEIIIGYTLYCDLIRPFFPDKTFLTTAMTQEIERCRMALELAAEGKEVTLICSGDAGIYGMASPVLELAPSYGVEVVILPGVTAASSGAALLGSPITSDFAVISLSDLLTPQEQILRRIEAAAAGGFCTVIYNPGSRRRTDQLRACCEIFLKHRPPETVCGVARNISREGEAVHIMTLSELAAYPADMLTTVFIGNGDTRLIDGRMVTLRGYRK